jgi:hypothetical protein
MKSIKERATAERLMIRDHRARAIAYFVHGIINAMARRPVVKDCKKFGKGHLDQE